MGISAGPNIVRDSSLVLDLDASDRNSASKDTVINLLPNSQNFFGSPYNTLSGTISTGSFVAPDSTNTATLLTEPTIPNNINRIYFTPSNSLIPNTYYNVSFYVKANGRTKGISFWEWTNGRVGVSYDLTAVTTTAYTTGVNTLLTGSITSAGNGWYRISYAARDATSMAGINTFIRLVDDTGAPTYTGNGLSGSFIWGLQLEKGTSASTYVPTTSTISLNSTWYDVSGNNITGSLTNGVTFNNETQGSLYFDGTNDFVTCGTVSNAITSANLISVFAWFKCDSTTNGPLVFRTFDYTTGWNLWVHNGFLRSTLRPSVANNNNNYAGTILTGSWYYGGFTCDNTTITQYLNGIQVSSTPVGTTLNLNNNDVLKIGGHNIYGQQTTIQGMISKVEIYNKALSATEVTQNYNATKSRFGLR
jgi:hypothetical protein